ncbi:MAG: hypothetical protein H6707_17530 [Deltaproteobacteria bacterium]|nr:hypothetical protein [Deltaproteobacteria bacterium]
MPPRSASVVWLALALGACSGRQAEPVTDPTCVSCHEADRQRPTLPDHAVDGFPTACHECHNQKAWSPASFQHRQFPLKGGHSQATCKSCHDRNPLPTTCVGCHDADRQRPKDPDHTVAGFSTDCESCHTVAAWKPAAREGHDKFPLTGVHSVVSCDQCHQRDPLPTTCIGCHRDEMLKVNSPDHTVAGFPQDCLRCHSLSRGWRPASFDHSGFPLSGKHATTACINCHSKDPVPKACAGCHLQDRPQGTTSQRPDHFAAGFSTDCASCHLAGAWKPAAFDHSKFPLTGAHAGTACESCHKTDPPPRTCGGCHELPKNALPDHTSSGFPQDCAACHNASSWKPATFDHSSFWEMRRSAHKNAPCNDCHYDPADHSKTSCFVGCHKHTKTKMDAEHRGKSGYTGSGDGSECIKCHERG